MNHTKRMRAMNKLQASLDHPAPASRKEKANFTNAGPGRILKSGDYATGGEFDAGEILRQDAPGSLIKSITDKHVETMINEVGEYKLATRSDVVNYRDQCLAHGRVAASLGGVYQMNQIKAEGGFEETASPILFGGGVMFKVLWADVVLKKIFEETTQIVTKEYLERYFHDLYCGLIVCDKE